MEIFNLTCVLALLLLHSWQPGWLAECEFKTKHFDYNNFLDWPADLYCSAFCRNALIWYLISKNSLCGRMYYIIRHRKGNIVITSVTSTLSHTHLINTD